MGEQSFHVVRGCNDPDLIARFLKRGKDINHPVRFFEKEKVICTNFEGSEYIYDWMHKVEWCKIKGESFGYIEGVN